MKNKKSLKNGLGFLALSAILIPAPTLAADSFFQEQIRVNNYYRELVNSQLDTMVPKGNYAVDVNAPIDNSKLKNYFAMREVSLDLPMSGTLLETNSSAMHQEAPSTISLEELLRFVGKKSIRIGVSDTVSPVVRNLIIESVQKQLSFAAAKGETVETFDLPKEFAATWVQWLKHGQLPDASQTQDYKALWLLLGGIVLFCGMIGVFFYFGIKTLSQKVMKEVGDLSKQWSDNQAPNMDQANAMVPTQHQAKANKSIDDESMNEIRIFEKFDLAALKLVCADSVTQQQYQFVPYSLIFHWLDSAVSETLDQAIPESHKPFPTSTDSIPGKNEVTHFLVENFPQYRNLSRSEFAQTLSKYSVNHLAQYLGSLPSADGVVLLEKITPLKKRACIAAVSIEKRIEWSKIQSKKLTAEAQSSKEAAFAKGLEKFVVSEPVSIGGADQGASVAQGQFLEVTSFSDDEQLYEITKNEPHMYEGMLKVIHHSSESFWKTADVKEMAMVTFGYSPAIRTQIENSFTGKRRDWFKSFAGKYSGELSFNHPMVVEARKQMLSRHVPISTKESETVTQDDNQKAA